MSNKPIGKAVAMIATPSYTGTVCTGYATALSFAAIHCALRQVVLDVCFAPGFSVADLGRNYLVAEFLERKHCTHLFWIDDDLGFEPTAVHRFITSGKDAIAGVYSTKSEDNPIYPYTSAGPPDADGIQLAERVPGGFFCLSRAAIERVVEDCKWYNVEVTGKPVNCPIVFSNHIEEYNEGLRLVGEDYTFCMRLAKAGIPIYVDTKVNFEHWGRKAYGANLAKTIAKGEDKDYGRAGHWRHVQGLQNIQDSKAKKNI